MFGFVVLFGLLHALFFLPICLSIMGPLNSHDDSEDLRYNFGNVSPRNLAFIFFCRGREENGREMQSFLGGKGTENNIESAPTEQPNGAVV